MNKAKPNSNSVNNSISKILGFNNLLDSTRGLGFPTLPSAAHTACLLASARLHSIAAAVLGGPPLVLASPKCCSLLLQLGCAFTIAAPGLSSWCKPSTFLHDPLILGLPLKLHLYLHQWLLLTSHRAKPQLLFRTASYLQKPVPSGRL